jgi:hypothetical protein
LKPEEMMQKAQEMSAAKSLKQSLPARPPEGGMGKKASNGSLSPKPGGDSGG